ncbi:MAG: ankyrin repeat domain-containing protein [Desulfomonile tiedjei]|nr:ankyrin repeat domain-containing protein [Desulfomonile tiedjei]
MPAELKAKDVLDLLRSGADNQALMERFHLSPKGLHSLFKKMVVAGLVSEEELKARIGKVPVDLAQMEADVRAGLDDSALCEKYGLSSAELEKLYERLVESGAMDVAEFYERISLAEAALAARESESRDQEPPEAIPPQPARAAQATGDTSRGTPRVLRLMFQAVQEGRSDKVKVFLGTGCDVNAKDEFGDTALILAADRGHAAVVQLLLECGADVNATDAEGKNALACARARGHQAIVELLAAREPV